MKHQSKRISILIICSVILPFIGYFFAFEIEKEYSKPAIAVITFILFTLVSLISFFRAHRIAFKIYDFKALSPLVWLAFVCFISNCGWLINNAWHSKYSFSYNYLPNYVVLQDKDIPNQFLFKGDIEYNAANTLIRKIMNTDNVDWDNPIALEIHSNGGSPQEAILMASFVKQYNIHVEVIGKCISACTRVLLASNSRYIHPRAWIGFHATYIKQTDKLVTYDSPHLRFFNENLYTALERLSASNRFIHKTKIQDSYGGFFPNYDDLIEEGIANRVKRVNNLKDTLPFYLE